MCTFTQAVEIVWYYYNLKMSCSALRRIDLSLFRKKISGTRSISPPKSTPLNSYFHISTYKMYTDTISVSWRNSNRSEYYIVYILNYFVFCNRQSNNRDVKHKRRHMRERCGGERKSFKFARINRLCIRYLLQYYR